MLGLLLRGAILTIAGLVGVFVISVSWTWSKGLDISCGCHGGDAPIEYWKKFAEFGGYFILLGWLWWLESARTPGRFAARDLSPELTRPSPSQFLD
jgi:hypothetical protein